MTHDYAAAEALTAEDRAAAYAVRMVVFVEEQRVPAEIELDEYDAVARHFVVRSPAGETVAAGRLLIKADGLGKIGRVAVLPEHRGRGVGRLLMAAMEDAGTAAGCSRFTLDAQCQAIPFYEKLGYAAEGEIFLDAGIEHRRMWKDAS